MKLKYGARITAMPQDAETPTLNGERYLKAADSQHGRSTLCRVFQQKSGANILMIDNRVEDVDEFVSGLSASTRLDWKVLERTSNRSSDAVRYLKYFLGGCELFFKRKRYGTVIAWQQFYGLFFAMLCRLFHVKKSCTLIVMTVIYKDKKGLLHDLYRKFYEYSITSGHIDAMTCVAKVECDNYSRIFHLPREKFHYLQWGLKDHAAGRLCAIDDKKYIFSAGKSNRDWEFVFDTIGTGGDTRQYNAVVVGSASEYQNRFDNITVLQNISDDEYYMLLARSYCVLISIRDVTISAGQITLLQAMQFGKPVILTQSEGLTNDYVIDGVNGLVVEKEKKAALGALERIYTDKQLYQTLSVGARKTYETSFSSYRMGLDMGKLLAELGTAP